MEYYWPKYHGIGVVQHNGVVEDNQRVPHKQVRYVSGQRLIQTAFLRKHPESLIVHISRQVIQRCEGRDILF